MPWLVLGEGFRPFRPFGLQTIWRHLGTLFAKSYQFREAPKDLCGAEVVRKCYDTGPVRGFINNCSPFLNFSQDPFVQFCL